MTDRHVLITGGAGYIGSILTSELLRANYRVTVLDSLLFGGESIVPFLNHPNFHFAKADVTEPRAVRDSIKRDWQKPDTVIHLAAIVGFPACQAVGKSVAWKYNVEATKTVHGQSAELGADRFVFASTYSNYGLSEDGKPVTEESPLNPQSLYAETKIASEEFLLSQKDSTCAPLLFRFATLYGISPRTRFDMIVNQFVLEAFTKRSLIIYQRGYSRSFVHIRDVVRGVMMGIEAEKEKVRGQIFNLGTDNGNYTKSDIVNFILKRMPETQIIRTFHWSYTLTGVVLAASAVGYFLSTFFCGFLVQRVPPRRVIVTGLLLMAVCMLFFMRWPSPWLNLLLNLMVGLGQGTIEVVTNLEVIHMERKGQSRLMNLLHAAFSVGAIVGPAAVGILMGAGLRGTIVFLAAAGPLLLMAILFGTTRFPRIAQEDEHGQKQGLRLLRNPILLLLTLFLLLYVGAELGVSTWVSEYFVKVLSTAASTGAYSVSLFWMGLFIGRLGVSVLYRGTRQEYLVIGLSLLSAAALGFVLLVSSTTAVAVGVFLTGLGLSALYPLAMNLVGRYFKSGFAVGTAATGGGLGSFTFPFLMAVVSETIGLRGGFWFYFGLTLVLVVLSLVILAVTRRASPARA